MFRRLLALLCVAVSLPLQAETSLAHVRALLDAKRYPDARALLEELAAADPALAEAHFGLGQLARMRGDTDEAVRRFERATALAPTNVFYFIELGGAYGNAAQKAGLMSKLGLAKKCRTALEKAVELDPASIPARYALVSYYREAPSIAGGGLPKAYAQAEEIRKLDPLLGAAVLGQLYLAEKKFDQALATFDAVLQSQPDNYLCLYSIGRTAAQTGQWLERGEQSLQRCLALTPPPDQPPHAAVHWRLGNIAERRGQPAAARSAYEAALRADPEFKQAAASLAQLQ